MQALGCDVAALNTVHFSMPFFRSPSKPILLNDLARLVCVTLPNFVTLIPTRAGSGNHTGYRQVKGTKASAQEIRDIYDGLRQSYLTDFDVLLSGYAPGAEAVEAVGVIARDLRFKSTTKPGSFFWGRPISTACRSTLLSKRPNSPRSGNGRPRQALRQRERRPSL